jgi:hypothetical protein
MTDCTECGMHCETADEYHPYAACLMFKGCHDGSIVRANLNAVVAKGAQYDSGFDDMADKLYAALADLSAKTSEVELQKEIVVSMRKLALAQAKIGVQQEEHIAQLEAALRNISKQYTHGDPELASASVIRIIDEVFTQGNGPHHGITLKGESDV